MITVTVEMELDESLWAEDVVLEMEDGFTWKGPWLLAVLVIWGLNQLIVSNDPASRIRMIRVGKTAQRVLQSLSFPLEGAQHG